jgi:serine/threonine protein kinase
LVNKRHFVSKEESKHDNKVKVSAKKNKFRKKLLLNDRYQINKKISQGGFGKVYLGTDIQTNNEVVVKVNSQEEINAHEFKIMKLYSGMKGFPKVYETGFIAN